MEKYIYNLIETFCIVNLYLSKLNLKTDCDLIETFCIVNIGINYDKDTGNFEFNRNILYCKCINRTSYKSSG